MARRALNSPNFPDENDETIDITPDQIEDVTDLQKDTDEELSAILSDFDATDRNVRWQVKVYEIEDKTGKEKKLFDCLPSDFPITERLINDYGTGNYGARVYKNGKLIRRLNLAVREPRRKEGIPSVQSGDPALLEAIKANNAMMAQLVQRITQSPVAAPVISQSQINWNDILKIAIPVVLPRFLSPPQSNGMDLKGFAELLSIVRDANDEGREKGFMDVISDVLRSPLLENIARANQGQPQVPQIPGPAQNRPANPQGALPGQAPPAGQSPQNSAVPPQQAHNPNPLEPSLKFLLDSLVSGARKNVDPVSYADVIEASVPSEFITGFLVQPGAFDQLSAVYPDIRPYAGWFISLVEVLTNNDGGANDGDAERVSPGDGSPTHVFGSNPPSNPYVPAGRDAGGLGNAENHEALDPTGQEIGDYS